MRVLFAIAALTLCLPTAWAEEEIKPPAPTIQVPYRLTDTKHVLVRAKINGKGPFNFVLDTGAPALFVSTAVGRKLGVEADRAGWGTFERFEIEGGVVLPRIKGRIEDPFQLEGMNGLGLAGVELHGIIGYTILARYRLEFDFTKTKMAWTRLEYTPPAPLGLDGKVSGGSLDAVGGLMKMMGAMLGKKADPEVAPRGFLGIELEDAAEGVTIKAVLANSPAAAAGLHRGDQLTQWQGRAVTSSADAQQLAAQLKVGTAVALTVHRAGALQTFHLKAGEGL